jgi:hypothetical protein
MEEVLKDKDLEAHVSFAFVLNGQIGDFFKLRHFVAEQLNQSRLIYQTFSRNPLFLVGWNDLSEEKKMKIKEVKRDEEKKEKGRDASRRKKG